MTVNDELNKASYRGIEFFYKSSTEAGGFKTAEHLYPGSDNFIVEQLGKVPRRFDIEARVKFDNRDAFDIALNTPGDGLLSHPMFGFFTVKVTQYTKSDAINDLGLYDYSIQFIVQIGLIVPTLAGITTAVISQLRAEVFTNITNFVNDDNNLSFVKEFTGS